MEKIFGVASSITTGIALSALAILVLYGIYKIIFENKVLSKVTQADTAKLVTKIINWVGIIAFVSLILTLLPNIINVMKSNGHPIPIREISGYVPRSVLDSKDGRIASGVTVTVRKSGTNLRDSPSLESPGKFLQEGTEANVVFVQNSWVKITLKGVTNDK